MRRTIMCLLLLFALLTTTMIITARTFAQSYGTNNAPTLLTNYVKPLLTPHWRVIAYRMLVAKDICEREIVLQSTDDANEKQRKTVHVACKLGSYTKEQMWQNLQIKDDIVLAVSIDDFVNKLLVPNANPKSIEYAIDETLIPVQHKRWGEKPSNQEEEHSDEFRWWFMTLPHTLTFYEETTPNYDLLWKNSERYLIGHDVSSGIVFKQ